MSLLQEARRQMVAFVEEQELRRDISTYISGVAYYKEQNEQLLQNERVKQQAVFLEAASRSQLKAYRLAWLKGDIKTMEEIENRIKKDREEAGQVVLNRIMIKEGKNMAAGLEIRLKRLQLRKG